MHQFFYQSRQSPILLTWALEKAGFMVIFIVISLHPNQISSYSMLCKALCEKYRTSPSPYTLNCYDLLASDLLDCTMPCLQCPEICTEQSFHKAYSCPGSIGKSVEIWRNTDETEGKEKSTSDSGTGHTTIMIGNDKLAGIGILIAIAAILKCILWCRAKKIGDQTRSVGVQALPPDTLL